MNAELESPHAPWVIPESDHASPLVFRHHARTATQDADKHRRPANHHPIKRFAIRVVEGFVAWGERSRRATAVPNP
jgi:hypothetical protein